MKIKYKDCSIFAERTFTGGAYELTKVINYEIIDLRDGYIIDYGYVPATENMTLKQEIENLKTCVDSYLSETKGEISKAEKSDEGKEMFQ